MIELTDQEGKAKDPANLADEDLIDVYAVLYHVALLAPDNMVNIRHMHDLRNELKRRLSK